MRVQVIMPDGDPFVLRRLLSSANHRQRDVSGYLSVGLTLTPRATARAGRNLCPNATKGCSASCFAGYDRMAWPQNKWVAVARTRLLAADPAAFRAMLVGELRGLAAVARERGVILVCRLNVVSDVPYEREMPEVFTELPDVQFMDYTKDASRVLARDRPRNYHLTFSRSERNEADCRRLLAAGHSVSAVFRTPDFPPTLWGFPVIDGDRNDLRFLDPPRCVVGLKAKGKGARDDRTGFVLESRVTLRMAAEVGAPCKRAG